LNNLTLVIGGTSGIGLETANYLLNRNYDVIVCGRRKAKLNNLKLINVDIRSETSVKELYNKVKNNFGDINSLVFSAGITSLKTTVEEFDEKVFHNVFDTNVVGFLRVLKYFLPSLKKTMGKVAVVNSIAGRSYSQFSGIEYTSSKGALSGIVKQLAIEWIDDGIFINSVFPSMTQTSLLKKSLNKNKIKKLNKELPLKRLATPFDTARAIEFLISNENKYITGTGIDISGGQFLNG